MSMLSGCFGGVPLAEYSGRDPELQVTMLYPRGWSSREARGEYGSYAQVFFREPDRPGKPLLAAVSFAVRQKDKLGAAGDTLEAFVSDVMDKRSKLQDAAVVSKKKARLMGVEGYEIVFSYKKLADPRKLDSPVISVRERTAFARVDDRFYSVSYTNLKDDFPSFDAAFSRTLASIRLK